MPQYDRSVGRPKLLEAGREVLLYSWMKLDGGAVEVGGDRATGVRSVS